MVEIMIPSFKYEGNDYVVKKIKDIKSLDFAIKFCDGTVNNIFVDTDKCDDYEAVLDDVFKKYKWLNRIIIKSKDNLIGVFKR
jgi:hypothetical protein